MRLKEDSNSWKASAIIRRDFRHDPGLPDTEVSRHKGKRKKKQHVHTYKEIVLGYMTTTYRHKDGSTHDYQVPKKVYICTGCGNRRSESSWQWYRYRYR